MKKIRLIAVFAILFVSTTGWTQDVIFVHYIDVGQGDSALLEFPDCGVMLIDAGTGRNQSSSRLTDYLTDFFASNTQYNDTISLIINSHPHQDHFKALKAVYTAFKVERYIDNGHTPLKATSRDVRDHRYPDGSAIEIREIPDSEVVEDGFGIGLTDEIIDPFGCTNMNPEIRILSGRIEERPEGWTNKDFGNPNNHSLVTRIDFGQSSFLFTGDMETEAIDYMTEFYDGAGVLDVDVYQVGHHGSVNGTTDDLLEAMSPEIAVISMGVFDFGSATGATGTAFQFGHPREGLVKDLHSEISRRRSSSKTVMVATSVKQFEEFRVRRAIYGTGWDGTVIVRANRDGTYRVTVDN